MRPGRTHIGQTSPSPFRQEETTLRDLFVPLAIGYGLAHSIKFFYELCGYRPCLVYVFLLLSLILWIPLDCTTGLSKQSLDVSCYHEAKHPLVLKPAIILLSVFNYSYYLFWCLCYEAEMHALPRSSAVSTHHHHLSHRIPLILHAVMMHHPHLFNLLVYQGGWCIHASIPQIHDLGTSDLSISPSLNLLPFVSCTQEFYLLVPL